MKYPQIIIFIGIFLAVSGLIIKFIQNNINTIALGTTIQPERFTELYFEDHDNLPKMIHQNGNYRFIFTIHNLESRDMEYRYQIYSESLYEKTILSHNTVKIKDKNFQSINATMNSLKPVRTRIGVELLDQNQLIDFWMEPET